MTIPPLDWWQYLLQVAVMTAQIAAWLVAMYEAHRPTVIEQGRAYPVNRRLMDMAKRQIG
jgi:hypothetical protein